MATLRAAKGQKTDGGRCGKRARIAGLHGKGGTLGSRSRASRQKMKRKAVKAGVSGHLYT